MEVVLCPIDPSELPQLMRWRNRDDIRSVLRQYRLLTMEDQEAWYRADCRDQSTAMFGIHVANNLVGVCGLTSINWKDRHAEVSIYVGPEKERQKGVAIRALAELIWVAFDEYGLASLWAEVYAFNDAGLTLFEKAGFKSAGRLRNHVFAKGHMWDSILFDLVKGVDAVLCP